MSEARKTLRDRDGSAGSSSAVLICLVVFAAVFIVYTTRYLSEPVAVHFGTGNQADGWMSRNGYLIFMLSFMIGMTAFITFVVGTLPAKFPQWTNVPNRDYWLAPKRRDESLRYLSAHGKRLGYLIVMMMLGPAGQPHAAPELTSTCLYLDLDRLRRGADLVDRTALPAISKAEVAASNW